MHDQSRGGPSAFTPELVHRAAARLRVRLGRTVHDLQIFPHEDGVVLSGRADTYYAKQLAQHVAMEIFGDASVTNKIDVH
jgi:osmotically-inducible protein OsmY